jgi:hypothetical protein
MSADHGLECRPERVVSQQRVIEKAGGRIRRVVVPVVDEIAAVEVHM